MLLILHCNPILSLCFFQLHFWIFQASSSGCANWPQGKCLKQQGHPASCRSWRSGTPGWTMPWCWMHWWEWQMKRQSRAVQVPALHPSSHQQLRHVLTLLRVCQVLLSCHLVLIPLLLHGGLTYHHLGLTAVLFSRSTDFFTELKLAKGESNVCPLHAWLTLKGCASSALTSSGVIKITLLRQVPSPAFYPKTLAHDFGFKCFIPSKWPLL